MAFDKKAYMREYNKNYKSIDENKAKQKIYQKTDKYKEYRREYEKTDRVKERKNNYEKTEKVKARRKAERQTKHGIERRREYQQTDKYKEYQREYQKNNKITVNLRNRLHSALKDNIKTGSAIKALGCSIDEFKFWLEKKFYPHPKTGKMMTHQNYGEWHLDHIIPLISAKGNSEKILELFHYTNIQPLWAEDNLQKNAKLDWKIQQVITHNK